MRNKVKVIIVIAVITFIAIIHIQIFAGALSSSKITISDSRAGVSSVTHTYDFTTGTTGTIASILFQYCTTATGSCSTPNGIDTTSAVQGSLTGIGASTSNFGTNGTITLTVSSPVSVNSGTAITIPYTSITNPTSINSSFFVRVTTRDGGNATIDSTIVAFATLGTTSLAVTADVNLTFTVSMTAVTSGSVNGASVNLGSTTATTIPFGTLTTGAAKIAAHDITVTTNASGGYVVTVKTDDPPLTDASNNIDVFTGTNATPTTWASPAGSSPSVNTGFFGYTSEDTTLCTGSGNRFSSNKWAGFNTTPYEVACNTSAVTNGETTRLGWQIEVNNVQPAGSYTGTIIVVTTPTY